MLEGDNFVFANALGIRNVKNLGIKIPMIPVKGWTVGIAQKKNENALFDKVMLLKGSLYTAPLVDELRIAGFAEIISDGGNRDLWGSNLLLK